MAITIAASQWEDTTTELDQLFGYSKVYQSLSFTDVVIDICQNTATGNWDADVQQKDNPDSMRSHLNYGTKEALVRFLECTYTFNLGPMFEADFS